MNTVWMVEKDLHEEEFYTRLYAALEKKGIKYITVSYRPFDKVQPHIVDVLDQHYMDLIVPYGCIDFLKWFVRTNYDAYSGAFFNLKELSFERYSAHYGKYLLNQRHVITTYADLIRRQEFFFDVLGEDNAIFVRPVSNDKVFTGRLFYREDFDKQIRRMGHNVEVDMEPHMLVVVAAPRNVAKEWRFAVVNREVVASSLYNVNGQHTESEGCDNPKAVEMAQSIAKEKWQPDEVYVVDIAETKGGEVAMLEVGSINSAGWYAMDCEKIVAAIEGWKAKHFEDLKG